MSWGRGFDMLPLLIAAAVVILVLVGVLLFR